MSTSLALSTELWGGVESNWVLVATAAAPVPRTAAMIAPTSAWVFTPPRYGGFDKTASADSKGLSKIWRGMLPCPRGSHLHATMGACEYLWWKTIRVLPIPLSNR